MGYPSETQFPRRLVIYFIRTLNGLTDRINWPKHLTRIPTCDIVSERIDFKLLVIDYRFYNIAD